MLVIDRILRQSKKVDKYNILNIAPTHERYEQNLCQTGHNFYCLNLDDMQGLKKFWNTKHAPIPSNYSILPPIKTGGKLENVVVSLPRHITFDFVISHQKFGQFQVAKPLSQTLGIPLIEMEHTLPMPNWPPSRLEECFNMKGDFNLFITEFNKKAWGWTDAQVLYHGLDTNLFCPGNQKRENRILTVANDYINRDWCLGYQLYEKATNQLPVLPVGDTPGLSNAPENLEGLINIYQTSTIFLNTATYSPIPMSLLEGMSCGCAVVSLKSCSVPEYIVHGENGLLAENDADMRLYLKQLLEDEKLRNRLGRAARETILTKCNMDRFCKEWNDIFEQAFRKE